MTVKAGHKSMSSDDTEDRVQAYLAPHHCAWKIQIEFCRMLQGMAAQGNIERVALGKNGPKQQFIEECAPHPR